MFKPEFGRNCFKTHCVKKKFMQVGTQPVTRPHFDLTITITNSGKAAARYVQVYAENLERQDAQGVFAPVPNFVPTYLTWTGPRRQPELDVLSPGMPRSCEIAHVIWTDNLPEPIVSVAREVKEDTFGTVTVLSVAPQGYFEQVFCPGNYRLTIRLGAGNAKTVTRILSIKVTGRWSDSDSDMVEFKI